jgi:hypothetical protein
MPSLLQRNFDRVTCDEGTFSTLGLKQPRVKVVIGEMMAPSVEKSQRQANQLPWLFFWTGGAYFAPRRPRKCVAVNSFADCNVPRRPRGTGRTTNL